MPQGHPEALAPSRHGTRTRPMSDAVVREWQDTIRDALARAQPLCIRGGGTKDFYGERPRGTVLDTARCSGIVDYDPTELVITVRGGTRLTEVESAMRDAGQMLAFEPPHFGPAATIGGCIAAGLSGPRRPYAGAVRDVVLGVRVLDGQGEDLTFGGRVMKNVAGFDVARAMAGALGTLGVLLDVSLKCLPLPKTEATRVLACSAEEALRLVNAWGRQPLPVSATCFHDGQLAVRLSGAAPAVDAAARRIGGAVMSDDAPFWAAVREHSHPFFAQGAPRAPLWRLSVRSTAPLGDLPGAQLIEWGGALRWLRGDADADAERVRTWARANGGHATLFRSEQRTTGVFTPLDDAAMAIARRLKHVFDPAGILNPGRMYAGL